jgi:hypothetical protein
MDAHNIRTIDVLQSQLFVLKVLSVAMASRWNRHPDDSRTASQASSSNTALPTSPVVTSRSSRKSRQPSSEYLSSSSVLLTEPPPLDEACAKYILSLMVVFLRQTAPPEGRLMSSANLSFEATFHDFETIDNVDAPLTPSQYISEDIDLSDEPQNSSSRPLNTSSSSVNGSQTTQVTVTPMAQHNIRLERTPKVLARSHFSLNAMILKFAGRIVYHLSASNWTVVLQRIRQKIRFLANSVDDSPDIVDLSLMKHSSLDRTRLVQILQGMFRSSQCGAYLFVDCPRTIIATS